MNLHQRGLRLWLSRTSVLIPTVFICPLKRGNSTPLASTLMDVIHVFRDEGLAGSCEGWYEGTDARAIMRVNEIAAEVAAGEWRVAFVLVKMKV